MEYRRKNITKKQLMLSNINPNKIGKNIRTFTVDSETVGINKVDDIYLDARECVPDENWELHQIYTIPETKRIFEQYKKEE